MDGEPTLRIFGEEVPVNCKVECMNALSGHADREELFSWLRNFKQAPKITFPVHGENPDLGIYAQAIRDELKWNVALPEYLETVELFKGI